MTRRILVVDDEDDIREVAQISLELMAGWEVIPARSGEEGIRRAEEERPDAILLDVMMPDLDGPSTLARIRGNPATAHIPVILLTARAYAGERDRLAELDVSGVLAKPFDPMELSAQVASTLGWPA